MPLVTSAEMFKKAYDGGYAIGAFYVNNMEIVQGITEACREESTAEDHEPSGGGVPVDHHRLLTVAAQGAYDEHDRRQHTEQPLARRYPSGDANRGGDGGPRICRTAAVVRSPLVHISRLSRSTR